MRILYVITSTAAGGAERALYDLAAGVSAAGHTVKVISLYPAGYYAEKLREKGIETVSLNMAYRPKISDLIKLKREIISFKPDVVHAMLYRAIQMCRVLKKDFKLFTTPHTNYLKKSKFLRLIDAALKLKDDMSLAESYSTADFLKLFQSYSEKRVKIILNSPGAEFKPDKEAREKTRAETGFENKTVFISVSRLNTEKGQSFLLNAFAKLYNGHKDAILVFAGDGPDKDVLQTVAQNLGLQNAVRFLGFRSDVPALLNAADIFVLPSLSESLPLALLEAAACGLPLIAGDTGDNAVVVKHGENGYICKVTDHMLLAAFMTELLENKSKRRTFGKKSEKIAAGLKTDYVKEHLEVYYGN